MVRDCSKHSPRSLGSLKTFSNPQTGAINHWSRKGEWAWRAAGEPSVGFRRASWVCVQDDSPYKWEMLQTCKGEDTKPYKYTFHLSTNTCYAENLAGRGRREATLLKEKRVSRESPKNPWKWLLALSPPNQEEAIDWSQCCGCISALGRATERTTRDLFLTSLSGED